MGNSIESTHGMSRFSRMFWSFQRCVWFVSMTKRDRSDEMKFSMSSGRWDQSNISKFVDNLCFLFLVLRGFRNISSLLWVSLTLPRWAAWGWIIWSSWHLRVVRTHQLPAETKKLKCSLRVYSWLCCGPSKSMKKILVITACCVWKNRWTWWSKCKNIRQQRQSPLAQRQSPLDILIWL